MPPVIPRKSRFLAALSEHRHTFIVIAFLTLIVTFPTIIYVFKTDVFWLPTGKSTDAYIQLWNIWFGQRIFAGQAARFYTDLMFYPEGVSLVFHPIFFPYAIVVSALGLFLPLSNAFSLAYLLIIGSAALSAYVYILWLLNDKWVALFGAVVFAFCPNVAGQPFYPGIAFITPIPLALYCFHRGLQESKPAFIGAAGLLSGLTIMVNSYSYVNLLILLGAFTCAFALSRWRDRRFWFLLFLLAATIAATSWWRLYPMLQNRQALDQAMGWHGTGEVTNDLVSFFINHHNPWTGQFLNALVDSPGSPTISTTSFLGFLPLLLCYFGIMSKVTRRKILPWAFLCACFLVLRLGSHLNINGVAYPDILLPKHYLNQLLPFVFEAFHETDLFMSGALLPFTVLVCYGLVALKKRSAIASKPIFILALVVIVAIEYYIPVSGKIFPSERLAYLDWLAQDNDHDEIRLINLPMGRRNSKYYNLFQALSGFPHAEGAISRTPDSAFDYIRSNRLLNAWHNKHPIHCEMMDIDDYLAGLTALEEDGFSHLIYHRFYPYSNEISESFRGVNPSYYDDSVSIYRLKDLRDSCPSESEIQHQFTSAFADLLRQPAFLDAPQGTAVVFPPTPAANDRFRRYLLYFARLDRAVVNIASDEQGHIKMQNSEFLDADAGYNLESEAAVWLVNSIAQFDAARTSAYQEWFAPRFDFCARHYEDDVSTIDLFLRRDIPCSAMDESSAFEVQYDNGIRLHNASFLFESELLRFYLAWTNEAAAVYAFSLQFFDEDGNKALQYDNVIGRELLSAIEIDASPLAASAYAVKLIVYDFETGARQSGAISDTGERFERELEITRIER